MNGTSVTAGRRLTGTPRRPLADSLFVSASLLAAAASGAGVALALTLAEGSKQSVDAVLAAYSLYGIAALLVADGRSALIPLFGPAENDETFVPRAREAASRTAMTATLAAIAMAALAPLIGPLVTGELNGAAQDKATWALILLAPAIWLQGRAAVCAAVLNAVGRVRVSAVAYIVYAVVSIGAAVPLVLGWGPLGAPAAILAGSLILTAVHEVYLRRFAFALRVRPPLLAQREQWSLVSSVLSIALVGLTMQLQLAFSLRSLPGQTGSITAYVYAFSLIMALLGVTSVTASTVALPDFVRELGRGDPGRAAARYVARLSTVTLAAVVPLLALVAAFGLPLLRGIFSGSIAPDKITLLYHLILVFIPMAVLFATTTIATPVVLARGRERTALLIAVAVLGVQLIADVVVHGHALAVGVAQSTAGILLALLVLVAATDREAPRTLSAIARGSAPAFALSAPFLAGALLSGHAPFAAALILALACLLLYVALGALLWPSVIGSFPGVGALRARVAARVRA
jgi:peptidoglycan biosynthesis protein MviN/MurJ (putative lipid II flippase)